MNELGKVASFLVKNCCIDTPIIVPTFPSIMPLETDNKEVIGLCKVPDIVKFPEVIKEVKVPTEVKEEIKNYLVKKFVSC